MGVTAFSAQLQRKGPGDVSTLFSANWYPRGAILSALEKHVGPPV